MESVPSEPYTHVLAPHIRNEALRYANIFFDNAYEGKNFSRITIEDVDALIAHPDFQNFLHCVPGRKQKELLEAFRQYNGNRKTSEQFMRAGRRGMDSEQIEEANRTIWELHHRPQKPTKK